MSYHHSQPPQMGATFIPGGIDDYYMPAPPPELVSPSPQRIMPEVPENMQDSLARLELDANQSPRQSQQQPPPQEQQPQHRSLPSQPELDRQLPPPPPQHTGSFSSQQQPLSPPVSGTHSRGSSDPSAMAQQGQAYGARNYAQFAGQADGPNFSPFPKIPNRPNYVPPSDDEKESILENARVVVLNSDDPEMQLAWAQDALTFVDAAMCHEQRISETQPARPVTPAVEHQLRVDAMNVTSFLADQHHPRAEFIRGMWLEFGKFGLRIDKKEAFRCYTRAADKGYARAEYRIGMQFESTNDPATALIHYKRGADQGDSASLYRLGMMTLLGQHGQQQDFAKGLQLIRQAAASADENAPQGAYVLGMLQARELPQINIPELHLPYSEKEARQSIERAAYLGFAKAQLKMGAAYELCSLGCDFNPALSLHYNALAARQGEAEAEMAISKWFLCGYEGVFQKNEELAYTYARRAAQQGLPTAEFAMGYFNEIGMNVPINLEKALEWYDKAAANGNKDAQSRIEGISKQRTLSKQDHENVAISRIRSQYGSKRGARPDRFKAQTSPLPNIVESGPSETPSRMATTTPYPTTDAPPALPPIDRPATVTPYPLDSGPPNARPGPAGGFFAPPDGRQSLGPGPGPGPMQRPASAFQINPSIYPQDNGPGRMSMPHPQGGPARPYSTVDSYGRAPQPGIGRVSTGPGSKFAQQRPATTGPAPIGTGPSPVDIGYTAPLQVKKQPAQGGKAGGLPTSPRPPHMQGGRASSTPQPGMAGRPSSNPSTPQPPGAFPQRKDSMPPAVSGGQPVGGQAAANKPAGPKPLPKPNTAPAAAAAPRPAGSGPKTFAEMGIPQAKQDNDCAIM